MKKVLVLAAASALLAGCALDPKTSAEAAEEKEYRTGSNIPARQRAGVHTVDPADIERQRAQAAGNIGKKPGMSN